MSKKEFCNECFAEIDPTSFCEDVCDDCLNSPIALTKEEKKAINKFIDEDWIEVKSPFKAYPPSEGV